MKELTSGERIVPLRKIGTYDYKTEFVFDNRMTKDIARQVSAEMMKSLKTSRILGVASA